MSHAPISWADPARAHVFSQWLQSLAAEHDLLPNSLRLASADASFRRYLRIDTGAASATSGVRSCIIMDAPPALEDNPAFVRIAELMHQAGLHAPKVLAWDQANGFLLLSDLGTQTMLEVMAPPTDAVAVPTPADHAYFRQAIDALVRWQVASQPGVLPAYDDALLSRELALFPEWYVARHRGLTLSPAQQAT